MVSKNTEEFRTQRYTLSRTKQFVGAGLCEVARPTSAFDHQICDKKELCNLFNILLTSKRWKTDSFVIV